MPSGLFSRSNFIVHDTLPGRQAGSVFPLSGAHQNSRLHSTFGFLLVTFSVHVSIIICCVIFLKTSLFLIISLYVSAYDFFSFFREEQQQVCLRFNVTPSANFLVCSKCVIGDSQQDRNARAYILVKLYNNKNSDRVTMKHYKT